MRKAKVDLIPAIAAGLARRAERPRMARSFTSGKDVGLRRACERWAAFELPPMVERLTTLGGRDITYRAAGDDVFPHPHGGGVPLPAPHDDPILLATLHAVRGLRVTLNYKHELVLAWDAPVDAAGEIVTRRISARRLQHLVVARKTSEVRP